jgi:hypothetical protein
MASMNDRREVGDEVVLRVQSTGSGVKVIEYDGTGFAEGIMTKRNRRYCYGENAESNATDYAYRIAEKVRDQRGEKVTVVELGEVMAEKLAEN